MDEYTKINHKKPSSILNNDDAQSTNKVKYLKNLITRVLLSVILVISICIIIKLDSDSVVLIDQYFFNDSLKFTKINNWYHNNIGNLIPEFDDKNVLVFSNNDLKNSKYTSYKDGVKIELDKNVPISLLNGGIIVFIGEKEDYGNTLILQGNDGIDYWYGGITNINVNLYDYLEKDTLIGETINSYMYLVLQKDGSYLNYDEYIN